MSTFRFYGGSSGSECRWSNRWSRLSHDKKGQQGLHKVSTQSNLISVRSEPRTPSPPFPSDRFGLRVRVGISPTHHGRVELCLPPTPPRKDLTHPHRRSSSVPMVHPSRWFVSNGSPTSTLGRGENLGGTSDPGVSLRRSRITCLRGLTTVKSFIHMHKRVNRVH